MLISGKKPTRYWVDSYLWDRVAAGEQGIPRFL